MCIRDRVGGMGHGSSLSLCVSLKSNKDVICIDGDGALIMHMGSMINVAKFGKSNFKKELSSVEYFLHQRLYDKKYNSDWFNTSQGGAQLLVDKQLSPYNQDGKINFNKFPSYSYHINAHEFGGSLRDNVPTDRYTEIKSIIKNVEYDEKGVKSLTLDDGSKISADLYVDCSGFKRVLIDKLTRFNPILPSLSKSSPNAFS